MQDIQKIKNISRKCKTTVLLKDKIVYELEKMYDKVYHIFYYTYFLSENYEMNDELKI